MSTITFERVDPETRKSLVRIQRAMREELRRLDEHAVTMPIGRERTACVAVMDWLNHSMDDIEDSLLSWMASVSVAPSMVEIATMLRQIREAAHLDVDDPRRIAAMVEKQRILNLIALDRATYHT